MKDAFTKRVDALQRRGLNWPLCSDLYRREDLMLLSQVEALSDDELATLTRLPEAHR